MGRADRQGDLFDDVVRFCEGSLPANSIYGFLARERDRLFPDGGYGSGWGSFVHTVLVDMRARLRRSTRPDRIFEVGLEAAHGAGLVGRRRLLDSTPLYDAVATMDTVTLIRSAVRGVLGVAAADAELAAVLRAGVEQRGRLRRQRQAADRLGRPGRPRGVDRLPGPGRVRAAGAAGWARARRASRPGGDAAGHGAGPGPADQCADGVFRIARRVAKDRVISTVDPEARHGHKTSARGFDGYKGHAAVDPDTEIITATTVTPGNAGDAGVAEDLVADLLDDATSGPGEPRRSSREPVEPQPVEPSAGAAAGRRGAVRLRR